MFCFPIDGAFDLAEDIGVNKKILLESPVQKNIMQFLFFIALILGLNNIPAFAQRDPATEAEKWLRMARAEAVSNGSGVDSLVGLFREYARRANRSIDSFGITEDGLNQLLRDGANTGARYWLQAARGEAQRTGTQTASFLRLFRENAQKAGQPITSFGATEEQLGELERSGDASAARYWLGAARGAGNKNGLMTSSSLQSFRDYATRSGQGLSAFGVSETQLLEIQRAGDVAAAKHWLEAARRNSQNSETFTESYLGLFRDYMARSGEPLSTFGLTEAELQSLSKQGKLAEARYWLSKARENSSYWRFFLDRALQSGEPIASFGLTASELAKLRELRPELVLNTTPTPRLSADEVNPNMIVDLSCIQETMRARGINISPKYLVLAGFYSVRATRPGQHRTTETVTDAIFQNGYCTTESYGGIPESDRAALLRIMANTARASEESHVAFHRLFGVNPRVTTNLAQISPGALLASESMDRSNMTRGLPVTGFTACHREMATTKNNSELRAAITQGCSANRSPRPGDLQRGDKYFRERNPVIEQGL